jgi:hypothetical protein
MPRNFLRAVIFDLGGTLMYERASWDSITAHADEALTNYLREQGMELNLSTFPREFRKRISKYFKQREKDLLETSYSFVLRDVLTDKGYRDVPDRIIRALTVFCHHTNELELEEDACPLSKTQRWLSNGSFKRRDDEMYSNLRAALVFRNTLTSSSPRPPAVTANHTRVSSSWRSRTGTASPRKLSWSATIWMPIYAAQKRRTLCDLAYAPCR